MGVGILTFHGNCNSLEFCQPNKQIFTNSWEYNSHSKFLYKEHILNEKGLFFFTCQQSVSTTPYLCFSCFFMLLTNWKTTNFFFYMDNHAIVQM